MSFNEKPMLVVSKTLVQSAKKFWGNSVDIHENKFVPLNVNHVKNAIDNGFINISGFRVFRTNKK